MRATIAYWYYLRNREEPFYPNACLLSAISNNWSGRYWKNEYRENPDFRNPRDLFWEEACKMLGYDLRNRAIIDVVERESDDEIYVIFCSGKSLRLSQINREGWNWLKEYCQQQVE
ncbi:MAG: hypothetical protein HC908_14090 [Calothrix sp. SM1_7_51]|nr:hypothetical protein [Calothrix sp. SM1_7_51]